MVSLVPWLLCAVTYLHVLIFSFGCGCQDFLKIDSANDTSPYAVGKRNIKITDKGLEASVFYPLDKSDSLEYDALWLENPELTLRNLKADFGRKFKLSWIPSNLLKSMTMVKIPATMNMAIAQRFARNHDTIRPLVFSHGNSADKAFYTAVHHALAAHGYLVIAVNH